MPCYRPVLKHPECERVSAFATRNSLIAEARALSHHAAIGKSVRRKSHMETSTRKAIAPRSAATGSVVTQADKIAAIIRRRPWRVTVPIPKRAPQETWVVETGIPKRLAPMTIALVTRLATNPWPWFIGVILWLITSATRRALKTPPRAIGKATTSIACVVVFVIDAVGKSPAPGQAGKVVVQHVAVLTSPCTPAILEVAHHLLFLGIHADYGPPAPLESPSPTPQQAKLPVAVRVSLPAQPLAVGAQRILLRPQQASHGRMAHLHATPPQGSSQLAGTLVCPAQASHRIPGGRIPQQLLQPLPHTRRFFSTRFRPRRRSTPGRPPRGQSSADQRSPLRIRPTQEGLRRRPAMGTVSSFQWLRPPPSGAVVCEEHTAPQQRGGRKRAEGPRDGKYSSSPRNNVVNQGSRRKKARAFTSRQSPTSTGTSTSA